MERRWIALTCALIVLLVAGAAPWLYFVQLPPHAIVIATGPKDGAYAKFGQEYARALTRDVTVVVLPTRGAVDNLALLHEPNAKVVAELIEACVIREKEIEELSRTGIIGRTDAERLLASLPELDRGVCRPNHREKQDAPSLRVSAGLVQGGVITGPDDARDLATLGTVFYEPLWLFGKRDVVSDGLSGLKGRKLAVGGAGSGTHKLVLELLQQHGIDGQDGERLPLSPAEGYDQLKAGTIDAAFIMAFWNADSVMAMFDLLREQHIALEIGSYPQADAYADLYPYLHKVALHRGAIDLANNVPPDDVTLIAAKASLVVRNDLHSATQYLLLNAAKQTHGQQGLLQRTGEFPAAEAVGVPLSAAAQQFYNSSLPYFLNNFLRNYLPFWIAEPVYALIPILLLMGALGFLRPLVRPLPLLFNWWIQRAVFRLLVGVMTVQAQVEARSGNAAEMSLRLARLEKQVNRLLGVRAPAAYAAALLMLQQRIEALHERLERDADGTGRYGAGP